MVTAAADLPPHGLRRSPGARLLRVLGYGVLWGVMMAGSAMFSLLLDLGRSADTRVVTLIAIYFAGGAAGLVLAWPLTRRPIARSSPTDSVTR